MQKIQNSDDFHVEPSEKKSQIPPIHFRMRVVEADVFDEALKASGMNRSEFIRQSIAEFLASPIQTVPARSRTEKGAGPGEYRAFTFRIDHADLRQLDERYPGQQKRRAAILQAAIMNHIGTTAHAPENIAGTSAKGEGRMMTRLPSAVILRLKEFARSQNCSLGALSTNVLSTFLGNRIYEQPDFSFVEPEKDWVSFNVLALDAIKAEARTVASHLGANTGAFVATAFVKFAANLSGSALNEKMKDAN